MTMLNDIKEAAHAEHAPRDVTMVFLMAAHEWRFYTSTVTLRPYG